MAFKMSQPQRTSRVPNFKILQVAGAVPAHPQTVRKIIEGKPVRGSIGVRITEELQRRGIKIGATAHGV